MSRLDDLLAFADTVKGFMPREEGLALFEFALAHGGRSHRGTWLEIGAWCGKSAVYLGAAAEATNSVLYSLDHHHGSEENQSGWEHHDAALVDPADGRLNTLPSWQRTIAEAQLESTVIGLVGPSRGPTTKPGHPRSSSADFSSSTTSSPIPTTAVARPMRSTAPQSRARRSSNAPSVDRCAR